MKPLELVAQRTIAAPIGEVWAVLADVPAWPRWCPPVRRVTHFDGLEVGGRLAYVLSMGPGVPVTFDVELLDVTPPRRLRWTSTKWWGVRGTRSFELAEVPRGTRVVDRKVFESQIWPVASLYPRAIVGRMSDGWLEGLDAEVGARRG